MLKSLSDGVLVVTQKHYYIAHLLQTIVICISQYAHLRYFDHLDILRNPSVHIVQELSTVWVNLNPLIWQHTIEAAVFSFLVGAFASCLSLNYHFNCIICAPFQKLLRNCILSSSPTIRQNVCPWLLPKELQLSLLMIKERVAHGI